WTGPNGFSSTLQSPTIPNAGSEASGTYMVTETVGQCVVQATTTVSIGPAAPVASNNNPVCAGKDLQLTASTIPGATYQWTGPNNYQSTQQNPVIPTVTPANSGSYSVTATVGGCTSTPASLQIAVHAPGLSAPQGGETWYKGQTYNIQWSGSGSACDSTVKIEAYKGGVFYGTITSSTADSGSYSWTISASYVIGSDYKIKITGNTNSSYTSQSNSNFVVVDPPTCSFVLTAPNGGETWYKGHSYNIAWPSPGGACSANVKIEAYKGDTFYATLANSTSNRGSYSWTVPSSYVDGSDYKIKITDAANATYTNQSSNPFTIGTALSPIFMDGYESGNTSAWSWRLGDGSQGNLANSIRVPNGGSPEGSSLCAAGNPNMARFNQNCGALVNLISGDSTPTYVQDNSPSGEPTYRVRFYINLRTLQMQDGDEFDIFTAHDGSDPVPPATDGNAVLRLVVRQTGGRKRLSAFARLNSGSETEIPATIVLADGWRSIEIDWAKATAPGAQDGRLGLWVDGTARTGLSGLDNDTLAINYSRLGAVAGLDPGTVGTFRTDDFVSQRSGYIGPAYPFADVATTSPFFPFIQGIYAAEIIPACSVGSFCSEGPITRKEMAMFLLLAKYGASYTPPACTTPLFNDVPCSSPWAPWINEIAREGVTAGCSPGVYCPDGNITRSQMSVFLMVAKGGVTPTACPPSAFNDIPSGSPFCPWIKEIANRGITAGCGGGNFCPESLVLRGQMAVFLSVTFGIPTHGIGP
ncbi:MAG TPA: Ser-Thr-rich GPI-anchored membrane family protein, partial [Thermoanaerobaculia bacterium]|nr:Ser-Thr-rich GPI-anchored membrane family protein [Thermoanaerobaculia bacterium]